MSTALPQIGSILARWSADDITPQGNDTSLQTWTDSVGSIAATQATSANRPHYMTNVLNGKPCMRFNGVDPPNGRTYQVGRPSTLVTAIDARRVSYFIVFKTISALNAFILDLGSNGGAPALGTHSDSTIGKSGATIAGTIPYAGQTSFSTLGMTCDIDYANGAITGLERVFINGGCASFSFPISVGTGGTGNIAIGGDYAQAAYVNANVDIFDIVIWNMALTPTEMLQCQMWACDKYAQAYPWAAKDRFWIFDGDSITAGLDGAGDGGHVYPYLAAQSLGLSFGQWSNLGIAGDTVSNMNTRASTGIDNVYALIGKPVALAAFEWYNHQNADPAPYNECTTYLTNRRSATCKVAFGTSTDNSDGNGSSHDTWRAAFNSHFDSSHANMDAYVAIHNDTHIGAAGAHTNFPANFDDGVHLTGAGYTYLAALFVTGLQALTFSTQAPRSIHQFAQRRH